MKKILFCLSLTILCVGFNSTAHAQLIINSVTTFATLDNSGNDSDPTVGVFQYNGNMTIATGGSITNNDVGAAGNSAGDINIVVTGNLTMQTGGFIMAENNAGGGSGGDITISVGGDFSMLGTAVISSSKNSGSGDTGVGGNISIEVTGLISIESASTIKANSTGSSGDITMSAGKTVSIAGTVQSLSGMTGTGAQGAGSIMISTPCSLTVTDDGVVSSRGQDPGADLVHLEGCTVTVFGLVESTGAGHTVPSPATKVVPPYRPDKPTNSTAGIEIWADIIIIDRANHHGELNADLSLGAGKRSWIDLFATKNISISGPASGTNYTIHANIGGNNGQGGIITAKSVDGSITGSGQIIQSNGVGSGFRQGGPVSFACANNMNLSISSTSIQATGVNLGGVVSLTSTNGNLNMSLVTTMINVTANGTVNESACGTIGVANITGAATVNATPLTCTGPPSFAANQSYVTLPPATCVNNRNCEQNSTLPVGLLNFTAQRKGSMVLLSWTSATEINNRGYEIERRIGSFGDFEALSFVNTKAPGGNSNSQIAYNFTDVNKGGQVSFYRLKQSDISGNASYSEIKQVDGLKDDAPGMLIYPNPSSNGSVNVIFGSTDARNIQLIDFAGRVINSWQSYKGRELKLEQLKPGTYMLKVVQTGTNETEVQKIVISH